MSNFPADHKQMLSNFKMSNPMPRDFDQITHLCKRVYPFSKPWSYTQLESHRFYFPDGQLIVTDENTGKVVGLAFSLIIDWNDYSPQDNWLDFTSAGYFHNHNPRKGKTLYGAEVMVDPECRGQGLGKMLYQGRQEIVNKYNLKRIRAGARLRGYSKFKDKLSPWEYVKQVVENEIYDPTLSFQLSQGFKVIGVAPNYLFNDPESLGYAAVIEWLSLNNCTAKDISAQKRTTKLFLSGEIFTPKFLPKELRQLVREATTCLGRAIFDLEGEKFYRKIEFYREQLKKTRTKKRSKDQLKKISNLLDLESRENLLKITRAFSLQLELTNLCDAAYRTWQQRNKTPIHGSKNRLSLTYVLTARPTETRSEATMLILDRIREMLTEGIKNSFFYTPIQLASQMRLLWLQSCPKDRKPQVLDETGYIYPLIFAPDMLDFILSEKPGYDLNLKIWLGGDKKGVAEIDKEVLKKCLSSSRKPLLDSVSAKLESLVTDLKFLRQSGNWDAQIREIESLVALLKRLTNLSKGDGTKIKTWSSKYRTFLKSSPSFIQQHQKTLLISRTLDLFPALVLPIELRENATEIHAALKDSRSRIRETLSELSKIAGAMDITAYACGLVVTSCQTQHDIGDACRLIDIACKSPRLPAIAHFGSEQTLGEGQQILGKWLEQKRNHDRVQRHWPQGMEVMLDYSGAAKQMGELPSRLLLARTMQKIDQSLRSFQTKPAFFHGSGVSVSPGGGGLKEQISWWSRSAIEAPKMSLQGEMIQRVFASKEVLHSQCAHFTAETRKRKVYKVKVRNAPELDQLAKYVAQEYADITADSSTLARLVSRTPYDYLDSFEMSQDAKTKPTNIPLSLLNTSPWVACWTQSRILLPSWWGVGTAWTKLSPDEKQKLKQLFPKDPFFSSFLKKLAFTLAKVELDIWELYLDQKEDEALIRRFQNEYNHAVSFVLETSGEKELLWYRPWLQESIRLRSSYIHILNLIQIIAMDKKDQLLMRETVTGIACGMLTAS